MRVRVFVAGATGVIGRQLVPQLVEAGHHVIGSTRSSAKASRLGEAGATAAVMDPLDRGQVMTAVMRAEPDAVIHELTALRGGTSRFLAQSYTGRPNPREGGPVKTEEDRLDPDPPKAMRESLGAIRYLEGAVPQAEGLDGLALRYGALYGPGTNMAEEYATMIRRTVAALDHGAPGVYNVVDDNPAPVSGWR